MMAVAIRKRCLVVGGTGVVGSALLRVLQREGAEVVFTYFRNEARAQELLAQTGARGILACDLRDSTAAGKAVRAAAEKLEGLDALIFAADQATPQAKLEQFGADEFDVAVAVSARGAALCIQAAAPALRASAKLGRAPNVVVIGSLNGVKMVPAPVPYGAAKAALRGIVETTAKDLGPTGVCANLVSLGIVEGGISQHLSTDLKNNYLKHCSLGRFAQPSEAAEVASWFALENTYITGQAILVEGGL